MSATPEDAWTAKDTINIVLLILYFLCLLIFSSFYYLATEDYEAISAVDFIAQGHLIGKSTGWPYTPFSGYLYYWYSLRFGDYLLGFRFLTALLVVSSAVPIYLTIRLLAGPLLAVALTLFSFSLSTFPHPRLEYFIEGSLAAYAIFFAVRFLQRHRRIYVYACAIFAFLAFASRGHPNSSALMILLPIGLIIVELITGKKEPWRTNIAGLIAHMRGGLKSAYANIYSSLVSLILTIGSLVWLLVFLRKVLYRRLFIEYLDVNDIRSASASLKDAFSPWVLLMLLATIYIAVSGRWEFARLSRISIRKAANILFPFLFIGALFILLARWVGYSVNDLLFFVFPVDIIADHRAVGRIGGRAAGILPVFLILTGATLYFYLSNQLQEKKAKASLLLLLLLPATFARFFPFYNMLYLGVFPMAVFLGCIVPCSLPVRETLRSRFNTTIAVFFIVYSVASNYLLLARTQLQDYNNGRLVKLQHGSLQGVFVESDVVQLFETIRRRIALHGVPDEQPKAFLSSRYVKFTPVIYQWDDPLAGQNLMIQLGKVWSYDDVVKIEGVKSSDPFDWSGMIYRWRAAVVDRLEQSGSKVIVMSLYEKEVLEQELNPSSDPFKEYLRQNFRISDVIEPTMNLYRRSSLPEGAIIFLKQDNRLSK